MSTRRPAQVRARADELRRSLDEVITALSLNAHMLQWEDILKKFATINLQVGMRSVCARLHVLHGCMHACMLQWEDILKKFATINLQVGAQSVCTTHCAAWMHACTNAAA